MKKEFEFSKFDGDDVIAFGDTTYKISIFQRAANRLTTNQLGGSLNQDLQRRGITIPEKLIKSDQNPEPYTKFFTDGIPCEILQVGSPGWKKGKIRFKLSVEFIPDELEQSETSLQSHESTLDDIRQMISE